MYDVIQDVAEKADEQKFAKTHPMQRVPKMTNCILLLSIAINNNYM